MNVCLFYRFKKSLIHLKIPSSQFMQRFGVEMKIVAPVRQVLGPHDPERRIFRRQTVESIVHDADAFPDSASGFASGAPQPLLEVEIPENLPFTEEQRKTLRQILSLDPRPAYQDVPEREYAMPFEGADVRFRVQDGKVIVTEYRP